MEIEKYLDKDYFELISLSHEYYSKITDDRMRNLCDKWLVKILGERVDGVGSKRNRNTFMMHLLTQMHLGKITGIFLNPPDEGPLPSSKRVFDNIEEDDDKVEGSEAVTGN